MPSGYPGTRKHCSVDGCRKLSRGFGLCDSHRKAWRRVNEPAFRQRERRHARTAKSKWTEEDKARSRQYSAQRQARRRAECYQAYGGYICACCGETEPKFLTLDHINNDGGKFRKATKPSGSRLYDWIIKNGFPKEFQVMCWNCNSGRARNGGICPHKQQKEMAA